MSHTSLSAALEACFAQCSLAELGDAAAHRAQLHAVLDAVLESAVAKKTEALDEDVERVATELAPMHITAVTDAESRELAVRATEVVHDAVAAGFERRVEELEEALLGDDAVQPGDRFLEWGIEVSQHPL